MRAFAFVLAGWLGLMLAAPNPVFAQGAAAEAPTTKRSRSATTRPKREPTAGQLAARERQKKCGVEWREAKAKGATGGLKWPQYWSKCNARLKGSQV